MASRLNLQDELETMLGSKEVYFQPPESVRLHYPAIIYRKRAGNLKFADNYAYFFKNCYHILIIDRNPDADWTEKMFDTFKNQIVVESQYTKDNLNHFAYRIYY